MFSCRDLCKRVALLSLQYVFYPAAAEIVLKKQMDHRTSLFNLWRCPLASRPTWPAGASGLTCATPRLAPLCVARTVLLLPAPPLACCRHGWVPSSSFKTGVGDQHLSGSLPGPLLAFFKWSSFVLRAPSACLYPAVMRGGGGG